MVCAPLLCHRDQSEAVPHQSSSPSAPCSSYSSSSSSSSSSLPVALVSYPLLLLISKLCLPSLNADWELRDERRCILEGSSLFSESFASPESDLGRLRDFVMLAGEIVVVVVCLWRVDASSSPAMLTSMEGLECLSVFDFVIFLLTCGLSPWSPC